MDNEVDCNVCLLDDVLLEVLEVLALLVPGVVVLEVVELPEVLRFVRTWVLEVEQLEVVEVDLEAVKSDLEVDVAFEVAQVLEDDA